MPDEEQFDSAPEVPADTTDPGALAKQAMDRARASARQRGATLKPSRAARREKSEKRRASTPFSPGRDPRPMSEAVSTLIDRLGWTEQIEVSAVTGRWREVVGEQIADHCEPLSFDEGTLVVKASSSAWSTQLSRMSGQIRHRINEEFGREIVKELTVVGPTARSWTHGQRRVKGRGPRDTYG
jgi:predicted nucleic acid-binding Zn ribbon protein